MNGIPGAKIFRDLIDEALGSNILPLRTKALMIAVIGRTLQCDFTEKESKKILEKEGLNSDKVEEILNKLASDELTEVETILVPLARDTVRARPEQIQPKMSELKDSIKLEEFIEFIGVASFANAFARLSCLLKTP